MDTDLFPTCFALFAFRLRLRSDVVARIGLGSAISARGWAGTGKPARLVHGVEIHWNDMGGS